MNEQSVSLFLGFVTLMVTVTGVLLFGFRGFKEDSNARFDPQGRPVDRSEEQKHRRGDFNSQLSV